MIQVSVVRYGNVDVVEQFIKTGSERTDICFTVADNGPEPSDRIASLETAENVRAVGNFIHNPGYFPAAFAVAAPIASDVEWVVISNCDLTVSWSDLSQLVADYDPSELIAIAPRVLDMPDEIDRNPHLSQRITRHRLRLMRLLTSNLAFFTALETVHHKRSNTAQRTLPDVGTEIYGAHGSMVILSREFFEAIEADAHIATLYSEEIWLAESAQRHGARIVFDPRLVVEHHAHATTRGVGRRARQKRWKAATKKNLMLIRRNTP